jgi:hypothetical protein
MSDITSSISALAGSAPPPEGVPLDDDDDDAEISEATPEKVGETIHVTAKTLPLFCLKQGLRRKESAFQLDPWIALSLTLDGRDKITKVLQYSARFLAWWLAGRQAERFQALKTSLTVSRKAYRLGRALVEYYKLRSLGLMKTVGWHLQQTLESSLDGGCISNLAKEDGTTTAAQKSVSREGFFYRSLSHMAYGNFYRPLVSLVSAAMMRGQDMSDVLCHPLWKIMGSATKMVGLFGFWTGDNVGFLTSSGLFDDLTTDMATRMARRKQIETVASKTANRFYFCGALAGLLVNLKSYWDHRVGTLQRLQQDLLKMEDDDRSCTVLKLEKAKEQEFVLFVSLLKSCCDVLVFSNNPGIDLWEKFYGRKLHDGVHCVGGLLSASAVLYDNFPNSKQPT